MKVCGGVKGNFDPNASPNAPRKTFIWYVPKVNTPRAVRPAAAGPQWAASRPGAALAPSCAWRRCAARCCSSRPCRASAPTFPSPRGACRCRYARGAQGEGGSAPPAAQKSGLGPNLAPGTRAALGAGARGRGGGWLAGWVACPCQQAGAVVQRLPSCMRRWGSSRAPPRRGVGVTRWGGARATVARQSAGGGRDGGRQSLAPRARTRPSAHAPLRARALPQLLLPQPLRR